MKKKKINETASSGAVGASSVAVNMDRLGFNTPSRKDVRYSDYNYANDIRAEKEKQSAKDAEEKKYNDMREKINQWKKNKKKKSFKNFIMRRVVTEDTDLTDVVSRLHGAQNKALGYVNNNVVSYGVEDDNGNIMRITVRNDQAKDFEYALARELDKHKEDRISGDYLKDRSLAEILFDLKDKFEIIDVKFPIIPTDAIYNADKATKISDQSFNSEETSATPPDKSLMADEPENDNEENNEMDMESSEGEQDFQKQLDDDSELTDHESVEDFTEEPESNDSTMLKSIIDMLKAQADAEKAKADAEAEHYRAKQSEFTALATQKAIEDRERMARIKSEMEEQKQREKRAKDVAEIAKYNVMQASGKTPFKESLIGSIAKELMEMDTNPNDEMEDDDYLSLSDLMKRKVDLQNKYRILPTDTPDQKVYKQKQLQNSLTELNRKIKKSETTKAYNQKQKVNNNNQNPNLAQKNRPASVPQAGGKVYPNNNGVMIPQ